jgi:hypothetical protein
MSGSLPPRRRSDRSKKVTLTAHVPSGVRKIYRMLAAELDVTMDDLQLVAHRSMIANFNTPGADQRRIWEELWKRFGNEEPEIDD